MNDHINSNSPNQICRNNPEFSIAGRRIGLNHPPYIVAELSGNHKGDLGRALALIDAAAATGADAIKIQTYTPDTMTLLSDRPEFVIKDGQWAGRTLYDLYCEAHTPFAWHEHLFSRAADLGIPIFSTPFDSTAVDLLSGLNAPAYKVASFEVIDLPLIARIALERKPILIATGMAHLGEIHEAVTTARTYGAEAVALLHCTSSYPAPIADANVRTVPHLGRAFACVAGLSDHTPGSAAAVASTVLGGAIVEKHMTLARADGGPDAAFSLEPDEFATLVRDCRSAWLALGKIEYEVLGVEASNLSFRRSLYVVRPVAAGETFTIDNVRAIRPGYGLPPKMLQEIVGRQATRDLAEGTPLSRRDVN